MRLIIIILLIISFLTIFIVHKNNKDNKEGFKSQLYWNKFIVPNDILFKSSPGELSNPVHKQITIQLNPYVIIPPKLGVVNKDSLSSAFGDILSKILPNKKVIVDTMQQLVNLINEHVIQFGLITENYLKPELTTQFKNIYFVGGWNYCCFTLIVPLNSTIQSWGDIKGRRIGTGRINSNDSLILQNICKSLRIKKNEYKMVHGDIYTILNKFLAGKLDAVFYLLIHPSPLVKMYTVKYRIRIITHQGLDYSQLKTYIPKISILTMDVSLYELMPNISKDNYAAYGLRYIIVANKTLSNEYIYKLMYTLMNNVDALKNDRPYLNNLSRNNIIYITGNPQIHPGTILFLTNYGYITENDDLACVMFNGKEKCTDSLIRNNLSALPNSSLVSTGSNIYNNTSVNNLYSSYFQGNESSSALGALEQGAIPTQDVNYSTLYNKIISGNSPSILALKLSGDIEDGQIM